MKSYQFTASDVGGVRKQGLTQAASANDVLSWLRAQGFTPISVNEIETSGERTVRVANRKRVKSADLAALCWQLTTMVEGGIPITAAIETINEDTSNVTLRQVLADVVEKMNGGAPFSEAVSEYPRVFNKLACSMIMAGEAGGTLSTTMRKLAEYYDNKDKLAKKVKGAMAYPIFVLTFILLIVIFIMTFIIPRFRVIFTQIGGDLPGFTKAFMAFYDAVRINIAYVAGSVLLFIIFCVLFSRTPKGNAFFSRVVLRAPLIGRIVSQAFIAMFCRTMATLLGAGVSVLEVFDILAEMTNNNVIKSAIIKTREHIVGGSNVSLSMAAAGFFPNMAIKMMQVGEESGSMSEVLERTAVYYERKVDSTIDTVMGLMEPIMIVSVGAIVLVVVLALYLPIFSISNIKG